MRETTVIDEQNITRLKGSFEDDIVELGLKVFSVMNGRESRYRSAHQRRVSCLPRFTILTRGRVRRHAAARRAERTAPGKTHIGCSR